MMRLACKRTLLIALTVTLLIAALLLSWSEVISIGRVSFTDRNGSYTEELPLLRPVGAGELVQITLRNVRGNGLLTLIPDDCFEQVSKNHIALAAGCSQVPIEISGAPCQIDLLVRNSHGGPSGVKLSGQFRANPVAIISATALSIYLTWLVAGGLGISCSGRLVATMGTAARIIYLGYTDIFTRSYDTIQRGGHLDYIRQMAQLWKRPEVTAGWEYHQPPLYYLLNAPIYKSGRDYFPAFLELQLVSLFLSIIFLLAGIAIFERLSQSRRVSFTASALLAFLPSALIHSTRLGNDLLVYPLSALALYFLLIWETEHRNRYFFLALLMASLSFGAKASGIPVLFTCLLLALLHRRVKLTASCLLACAILYGTLYYRPGTTVSSSGASGAVVFLGASLESLNPLLKAHPLLASECLNPLPYLLHSPFLNPWEEQTGSKCFGVSFLKSMLFGEFDLPLLQGWHIADIALGAGVILWLGFLATGIYLPRAMQLFVGTHLAVQLLYYDALRISPAADFRYVFPLLIPLCLSGAIVIWRIFPQPLRQRSKQNATGARRKFRP